MKPVYLLAATGAVVFAATLGALALAGDDGKPKDEYRERCLRIGEIYNWESEKGGQALIVESNSRHKYRVEFTGYCPELKYKETVAFRSPGGTSLSCLSPGDTVIYRDAGITQRCFIRKVSRYVADASPKRDNP